MSIPPSYPGQPYPEGQQPAPAYYPVPQKPATNGLGVAALVIGIVGIVCFWIPFLGLLLGIVAVVLGILGVRKKNSPSGTSIAGLILGIFATLAGIVVLILTLFVATKFAEELPAQLSATVSGTEGATVEYTNFTTATSADSNADGTAVDKITGGTWSKDTVSKGLDATTLEVTANDPSATVSCKIMIDGLHQVEQSGTGTVRCVSATIGK